MVRLLRRGGTSKTNGARKAAMFACSDLRKLPIPLRMWPPTIFSFVLLKRDVLDTTMADIGLKSRNKFGSTLLGQLLASDKKAGAILIEVVK